MTVPRDPGLQPERTRLAWRRTVLAAAIAGLLLARLAVRELAGPARGLAVAAGAAAWAVLLLVAHVRGRTLGDARPAELGRTAGLLVAGTVVGLAAVGLVVLAFAGR